MMIDSALKIIERISKNISVSLEQNTELRHDIINSLDSLKTLIGFGKEPKVVMPETRDFIKEPLFHKSGSLVRVKIAGNEDTHLGFLLGEFALAYSLSVDKKADSLVIKPSMHNPAMYVPKLGKIVYGMESWWSVINSEEDLEDITDSEIDNIWYIKLLRESLKNNRDGK